MKKAILTLVLITANIGAYANVVGWDPITRVYVVDSCGAKAENPYSKVSLDDTQSSALKMRF